MREKIWDLPLPAPVFQIMRGVLKRRVVSLAAFRSAIEGKVGLEIGGPSVIFQDARELPIYRNVAQLDNCVFSPETIWEGRREEGLTFSYHPRRDKGFNFVREGSELSGIADNAYDFVLSSHNLEHIANPIKALKEWTRVVKPSGAIIVVLPEYQFTFDHRRRPTSVTHMIEDYERGIDESDLTHFEEIVNLHDLSLDPSGGTADEFRERSLHNFENRCFHHHVFDKRNSLELLEVAGLRVEIQESVGPHHLILLARCPPT